MPIIFGPHACGSTTREWLVADGLGGCATGTVAGLRTRREHALLTVAGRVALASLDVTVTLPSGGKVPLFGHRWASGVTAPQGHRLLETFTLDDGVPRWRWRIGDVVVERELAMWHGHAAVGVTHRVVTAPGPVGLAVAAMCTWRPAGGARRQTDPLRVRQVAGGIVVEDAYRIAGPGWQSADVWHLDTATGEDLLHAGTYLARLHPGEVMEISAWAGDLGEQPPPAGVVVDRARQRARQLIATAKADGDAETLTLAADTFIVRTPDGPEILDGYPSGRIEPDLAAYEGLFLDTGRVEEGRELLAARARTGAEPLWLAHAVDRHVTRSGDTDLAAELAEPLTALLSADGLAETPAGKPVARNALLVNALAALRHLRTAAGLDDAAIRARHERARAAFLARFPAPEGWLHELVDGPPATYPLGGGEQADDPTLRAGQVLAWSLPYAPLRGSDPGVLRPLLTPLGLRTLAPSEYGFQPESPDDGAVRPWLIGPWADACAAAGRPTDDLLIALTAHLTEWGVGSVSEFADGEAPHDALGRPFAARSVAEVLRVTRGYAA